MIVSDKSGIFAERYQFVESMRQTITMAVRDGVTTSDRISHKFYWLRQDIQNPSLSDHINGTHVWRFASVFNQMDSVKSKAYGISAATSTGLPLAQIIRQVIAPYGFLPTSTYISPMDNADIYYQGNKKDFTFLNELTRKADALGSPSPFLSFINLQNEFYFMTLDDLLKQQVSADNKFQIETSQLQGLESGSVARYSTMFGGAELTEDYYERDVYTLGSDGEYTRQKTYLYDYMPRMQINPGEIGIPGNQSFALRGADMKSGLKSVSFMGLQDTSSQKSNLRGRQTWEVLDALLPYRIDIVVPYSPNSVSGHTAEVAVRREAGAGMYSDVYAGKYLIASSEHQYQNGYRTGNSILHLARPVIQADRSKPVGDPSHQFVGYTPQVLPRFIATRA